MDTGNEKITLKHIAEYSGVSRRVVSAIVSGNAPTSVRYSEATRKRVLAAMEELGYRPNRHAQFLREKRHGCIGVLADNINVIPANLLKLMVIEAGRQDLLLVVEHLHEKAEDNRLICTDCVDALVIFETVSPELLQGIRHRRIPLVLVNSGWSNEPNSISFDDQGTAHYSAELMARKGRKRPGIIVHELSRGHHWAEERITGFEEGCKAFGLNTPIICEERPPFIDDGRSPERMTAFLEEHPELDSLLLINDDLASDLYPLCAERGIRIPADLSVISYNDSAASRTVRPRLASFRVDPVDLALAVMNTTIAAIKGESLPPRTMPFILQRDDSV